MKKNLFYIISVIVITAGCGGLHYFDFHPELETGNSQLKIDKILYVEDIQSGDPYLSQNIVFRKNPYRLEFFLFKQWAKRPGELIRDAVVSYYRQSSTFRQVLGGYSSVEPDLSLKIHIYFLEMQKEKKEWYARLALDLEFMDKASEKVVITGYFDRKEKIRGKDPQALSEKISQMLCEELIKAAEKLKKETDVR